MQGRRGDGEGGGLGLREMWKSKVKNVAKDVAGAASRQLRKGKEGEVRKLDFLKTLFVRLDSPLILFYLILGSFSIVDHRSR